MWVTSLWGNGFNEMLMPVLWVINPVSLKLDCEQKGDRGMGLPLY